MTEIRVRGYATEDVSPDFAVISLSAIGRGDAAAQAQAAATLIADAVRTGLEDMPGVRSLRLSRVSVHQRMEWNESTRSQVAVGWEAQIGGTCEADAGLAGDVAGALVDAGAEIGYISWQLEAANPAHRRVRVAAVGEARRAGEDFAAAVGGELGELLTLSDPGLLSGPPATAGSLSVQAEPMMASAKARVELDEALVTVTATVEAAFGLR